MARGKAERRGCQSRLAARQDGERERVKTHWKMYLQMSSLREDELEALEPRREPKLGRATDERLRMAGGGVGGGDCVGAESQEAGSVQAGEGGVVGGQEDRGRGRGRKMGTRGGAAWRRVQLEAGRVVAVAAARVDSLCVERDARGWPVC